MMPRLLAVPLFTLAVVIPVVPAEARAPMCAIDMGSNTFRRIVGSFENGRYDERHLEKRTLGVGDDVAKHGRISDAKLAEIEQVLAAFKASCVKESVPKVAAVGTAAFRDAPNGPRVVEIAAKLGIAMEIATEARESHLAYLVGSLGRPGYAVIDNGSRSIELVSRDAGPPRHLVFNLGYRVAYDKFFAPAATASAAVAGFRQQLEVQAPKAPFMRGRQKLVGVEFAEMAEVLFDPGPTEGRVFTLAQLKQRLQQITALTAADYQALKKKTDIDRALPRLAAAAFFTEAFGYSQLELTARELGVGLIIEAGLAKP